MAEIVETRPRQTILQPALAAEGIARRFRTARGELDVLRDVSFALHRGEFVCLIGPSGSGKSTLLEILCGLQRPDEGRVLADGRDITGLVGPIGYMPQKDLLLPWKLAVDNAAVGLELLGIGRRAAREEAESWFPRFGLAGFEKHYPATLSGGMRQRLALLRTFLARRETLLLDEPLGALDALTRRSMQTWLLDMWADFGKTILLVTHDVDEAVYLSDRILVFSPRPGTIVAEIEVPLARPRAYEVVTGPVFTSLKRELLGLLVPDPERVWNV
ncbi:MAG TPA: ABC transporter ATP-binding protein [Chloroflexota bacterium]|nr:ABC transporter ATP-binding protein [Chloroflexota bacterium]